MSDREATSVTLRKELESQFNRLRLIRPFRRACYDPGDQLDYHVTGVAPAHEGRITVAVEDFIGGGFAGQVYRVRGKGMAHSGYGHGDEFAHVDIEVPVSLDDRVVEKARQQLGAAQGQDGRITVSPHNPDACASLARL